MLFFSVASIKVFNLLRNQDNESYRGCRHLELFQEPVCNRGFMRLLGLGKSRFRKLHVAARDPEIYDCPVDGRFMPSGPRSSQKEQLVFSFLDGLYQAAAESLPDCPAKHASNKRPRQGEFKRDDPNMDRSKIRHLPPGNIVDYLRLFRAEHPTVKVSNTLFTKVWTLHFGDKLRIRHANHHSKCAVCIRHRLIIRRLGNGPGRLAQLGEYRLHLRRQYRDRSEYWQRRSTSSLEASSLQRDQVQHVCGILDSMDQAKHCWPRSAAMASKEFNSWPRPKMSSTTLILHGHGVCVALSPPNVATNSSRTVEILSWGMTKCVQHGVDWRRVHLSLHSDNCAKECKNQTVLRFLGYSIATHRLRAATLACLQSGHSHEDVDALFSTMANYLNRHPELWTMSSFKGCFEDFFSQQQVRPLESSFRHVEILTTFHDWILGCFLWSM